MQINDRYEFPLQLDLDRDDGKYLSPEADRRVRNLYTLHRRKNCLRAMDRTTQGDRATDRATREEIRVLLFFLLFFFLPPSAETARNRPATDGNNRYLAVPPGSGRSTYQSAGRPVRTTCFWLIWNSGCSLKMEISFVTKELPHYKMATNIDILMFLLSWSTFVIARSVYSGLVWMAILAILSKLSTYDDVVERVARQLGLDDPSKIRLTSHNCYSQQPKPQPIKFRGLEHLSEMLVHYNQVELSRPDAELRLLEVFYHKIYKQVQNFGEPFFLVIREGETLADVKIRVQKKLQVPDEEFSKYLGLEHSDTAPKRAYTSNQVKWLLVCRPVGNGIV
ncbi:hypothetical protein BHM03_00021933, partial [Ensete ventricosum]